MKHFYCIFLSFFIYTNQYTLSEQDQTDAKKLDENITLIFNQIPTTQSIYQEMLEKIYTSPKLQIPTSTLTALQKTYAYLEFLTKLEKISENESLITSSPLLEKIFYDEDAKASFPSLELEQDFAWNSIKITMQDVTASSFWQNYIKIAICNWHDKMYEFIENSTQVKNQMSVYLANIETAYQTNEYTSLRYYSESIETELLIAQEQLIGYQKKSIDWSKKNSIELAQAIAEYKKTDMYQYLNNPEKIDPTNPIIPNPYPEYIIAFILCAHIQDLIFSLMTTENIESILLQASFFDFTPNFFTYVPEDFCIVSDFIFLQNKKDLPEKKSFLTLQTTENNSVVIQNLQKKSTANLAELSDEEIEKYTNEIAEQLFNLPIATRSIESENIQKTYSGILTALDLEKIQKTFCFLEYLAKKEIATRLPDIATTKKEFFTEIAKFTKEESFIPTEECIEQSFWNNISVTPEQLMTSSAWQFFIKTKICDLYDNKAEFILNHGDAQQQMLPFLASIEQQYNSLEYTELRLYAESIQLKSMIEQEEIYSYLAQCSDWKNLSQEKLISAINKFKTTEFYTTIYNKNKSNPSIMIKEYIVFYYMISSLQTKLYDMLTLENLDKVLSTLTQEFSSLKVSQLTVDNFALVYDFLTLSLQLEENKKVKTTNVVIQSIGNPFKKSNKIISKGFNKEITKPTQNKFVKPTEENFAKPIRKGFNKEITKPTQNKFIKPANYYINHKLEDDIKKGFIFMVDGIGIVGDALATGFIETMAYGAFITYSIGKGFGANVDPKAQQARTRKNMNKHKGVISTVFAVAFVIATGPILFAFSAPLTVGLFVGAMVVDKRISEPFKIAMMKLFEGLAFVTNKMTDGFILMSADFTYAGAFIGQSMGFKVNAAVERERVRAKLEAQRNTLNIVMSVVLIVVITAIVIAAIVLTGGAAAAPAATGAASAAGGAGTGAGAGAAAGTSTAVATGTGAGAAAGTGAAVAGASATATISAAMTSFSTAVSANIAAISAALASTGFLISQIANAAFTTFSAMAAIAQDRAAAKAAQTEKESVHTLWKHIEDNKYAAIYEQESFVEELYKKHQVVEQNQTTGLQFYKNYIRSGMQNLQEQISQILTLQQISLLQEDAHGCKAGDIGYAWGLKTSFLNLYPSQGFLTVTQGRKDFPYAQEIAQAPLTIESSQTPEDGKTLNTQPEQDSKLWAHQKVIAVLEQQASQPLEVKINFKIIHNLDEFHVGLYLGGIYHNYQDPAYLTSLQNGTLIDLASNHLAKYIVIERRAKNEKPWLAVYEHQGKGLLFEKQLNEEEYRPQTTYFMHAYMDGTQLTIHFSQEKKPEKIVSTTIKIQPSDQRTFGIIFSGAAVTWNVIAPNLPIINTQEKKIELEKITGQQTPLIAPSMPETQSLETLQTSASQTIVIDSFDLKESKVSDTLMLRPEFAKSENTPQNPSLIDTLSAEENDDNSILQQEPINTEILSFSPEDFALSGGFAL